MPLQVVPDGAGLELLFRMDGRTGLREQQSSGGGGRKTEIFLSAIGGHERALGPGIRIGADQPVVSIDAYVRVRIEVVAEAPALSDGVVVGSDVDVMEAE